MRRSRVYALSYFRPFCIGLPYIIGYVFKGINMLIVQEDTRMRQAIKNTRKEFRQQQQQMESMALVAHEAGCDIFTCPALTGKQAYCFKYEPDKIVGSNYDSRGMQGPTMHAPITNEHPTFGLKGEE